MAKNIMVLGETGCFWPKIALTAENSTYGLKFSYSQNFGYDRILAFLKPFLAVTVFRQKNLFWSHTTSCTVNSQATWTIFGDTYTHCEVQSVCASSWLIPGFLWMLPYYPRLGFQ